MVEVQYIDRRKCRRVVPMRVLCLGAGRTGTECECTCFPPPTLSLPLLSYTTPWVNNLLTHPRTLQQCAKHSKS